MYEIDPKKDILEELNEYLESLEKRKLDLCMND